MKGGFVSRKAWLVRVVVSLIAFAPKAAPEQRTRDVAKRPVTVADAATMTRIGEPLYVGYTGVGPKQDFAAFSPDGSRFAFVISKGNLEKNVNEYSLLVFRTANTFNHPVPRRLVTFSSASNNQGVSNLRWLADNDTLLFLGTRGVEPTQLYSVRSSSGKLKRLTNHSVSLKSYATSADGRTLVYLAEKPHQDVATPSVQWNGLDVMTEDLSDLIAGKISTLDLELFATRNNEMQESRLQTRNALDTGIDDLFLSPDGRYLILKTDVRTLPKRWEEYEDQTVQTAFRRQIPQGSSSGLLGYEIIDIATNKATALLDAPASFSSSDVVWSPDSRSVILSGVYLPLDVSDPTELNRRRSTKYAIEIELPSRKMVPIASGELKSVSWNAQTNVVQFHTPTVGESDGAADVYYQKIGREWKQVQGSSTRLINPLPDIRVDQDLNVSPQIVAVDARTQRRKVILNLNPQFSELALAQVKPVEWKDGSGDTVSGGLYLPPDYVPGRRYPLVIQTHGFDRHGFWIDGPWSTAFAAQPLASHGIMVLQVNDSFGAVIDTPNETEHVMSVYEGAVDLLDSEGIIDRGKVGIIGFSRTCLYVKYALTHSRQHFAAAVASDGFDGGYFEYVAAFPLAKSEMESVAGAAPFGQGLERWLRCAPGFLLDRVQTPIQLQANAPASLFEQWEWFSGLQRLNKPVDLFYLPADAHILIRPRDRMLSEEQSVDWFRFWLKGEEDRNPAKAEQYARWRALRNSTNKVNP
jgi:dipeptidyl aminopeptidase/acylaminoacyl peptidase